MTAPHPVLIDGHWRNADSTSTFRAFNPETGEALDDLFPTSTAEEVTAAVEAGYVAAQDLLQGSAEQRAVFLEYYADLIEEHCSEIVALAHLETALPEEPRLANVELPRTVDQLRQAAQAVRDRSWCNPVIDTGHNIRSQLEPLGGPVVVFGPNNFPLAFNSISGGDFAAAIAAGNPVIAKGHPAHPATTHRLAELASIAVESSELPAATVQLVYDTAPEVGLDLVAHPKVGAVAFTGSKQAGLALKEAADRAGTPIYLEMASVNPVFILQGALEERFSDIVTAFVGSCTLAAGQFCTNPGLVVVPDAALGERFVQAVADDFSKRSPDVLFAEKSVPSLKDTVQHLEAAGAHIVTGGGSLDKPGYYFANTLLCADAETFLRQSHALQVEAFGPVAVVVLASNGAMVDVARVLEGSLTASVYSHEGGRDDVLYNELAHALRPRVGRLLNDKMPTGVAVSPAMNHGGPYPATGHPGFTSVGIPAAIQRFTALRSYDNVRQSRLPVELRDANPLGIWRRVDGTWSQAEIVVDLSQEP